MATLAIICAYIYYSYDSYYSYYNYMIAITAITAFLVAHARAEDHVRLPPWPLSYTLCVYVCIYIYNDTSINIYHEHM